MHIPDNRLPVVAVRTDRMASATLDRTSERISKRVVDALAAATDTDPLALNPPLYRSIDPEALDRLFEHGGAERVRFEYDDHTVVVRRDGTITVDGTRQEA